MSAQALLALKISYHYDFNCISILTIYIFQQRQNYLHFSVSLEYARFRTAHYVVDPAAVPFLNVYVIRPKAKTA